jgi:hypothetical protein
MNQTRNAPWSNQRTQALGFENSAFLHEDFSREPNRKKIGNIKWKRISRRSKEWKKRIKRKIDAKSNERKEK